MIDRIGRMIAGRYRIENLIGRGGMADVFRGVDIVLDRQVAIKLLTDRSDVVRKRFLREAQSMASLNHRNIVGVFDAGDDEEQLYIIMELVSGQTLRDTAERGIATDRAIEIFIALLEALDYAHVQHVIHRDIKPANVMILEDSTVKVMDFGLSRRVSDMSNVTQAGEIVGTIAYLSPERFLGKTTDARSDLYSVGIVMYEIFTGDVPFKSESDDLVAVIFAHVNEAPVAPHLKNSRISLPLERVILRLLAKDPVDRYPTARDAIVDLQGILAAERSPTSRATNDGRPTPPVQDSASSTPVAVQDAAVRELLDRTFKPTQIMREAQKDVLAAMLAARKRDYREAARSYAAALEGFKNINNAIEYARTALKFAATLVERTSQGEEPSKSEFDVAIVALQESLPTLRGKLLYGEMEEGERALYALQRLRVNAIR